MQSRGYGGAGERAAGKRSLGGVQRYVCDVAGAECGDAGLSGDSGRCVSDGGCDRDGARMGDCSGNEQRLSADGGDGSGTVRQQRERPDWAWCRIGCDAGFARACGAIWGTGGSRTGRTCRGNRACGAEGRYGCDRPARSRRATGTAGEFRGGVLGSYQGTYSSSTNYVAGDVVVFGGSSYTSLVASNHGNTPGLSPSFWGLLAQGGTGPQGPQGPQGITGPAGLTGLQGPAGPTGATGAAGPAGSQGAPGLVYQGAYSSTMNYALGDVVLWNGASYTSLIVSNHGNTPSSSPAQWGVLTAQGPAGPIGATGATGAQGPQGLPGSVGPPGEQGPQGVTGDSGTGGGAGFDGRYGRAGVTGADGAAGRSRAGGDDVSGGVLVDDGLCAGRWGYLQRGRVCIAGGEQPWEYSGSEPGAVGAVCDGDSGCDWRYRGNRAARTPGTGRAAGAARCSGCDRGGGTAGAGGGELYR